MLEPMGCRGALVDPHELLRDLRASSVRRNGEAILLGEVNLLPVQRREFFGDEDGDELHMLFSFHRSTRRCTSPSPASSAAPLEKALRELPAHPLRTVSGRASSATTTS